MSFWRQGLKNAGFLTLQAALVRGGGLAANLFLARMLSPAAWGLFNAIVSANQTLYQSMKFSIDSALHVRFAETKPEATGLTAGDFAGGGILAMGVLAAAAVLISLLLADPVAQLFGAPEMAPWMIVAGIGTAAQFAGGFGSAALFGSGEFRRVTVINAAATAVYLGLLALALATGWRELWPAVAAFLVLQIGTAVWTAARGLRVLRQRGAAPVFAHAGAAIARLIPLGMPLYLSSFIFSIATFFLMGELSRIHGVGSLAGLRVAQSLSQLVLFLPSAVAQAFITQFARARSEAEFPAREFARYLKLVTASTVLTMLAVAALAPMATPVLFGSTYAPAVDATFIALVAAGIQTIKQAIMVGYISEGRTGYALLDSLLSTATVLMLGFELIPEYGVSGFLVAQGAGQAVSAATLFGIVVWRTRRDASLFDIVAACIAMGFGLAATLAGHWTAESPLHLPVYIGFLAVAVVVGGVGLIRRNERERFAAIAREIAGLRA